MPNLVATDEGIHHKTCCCFEGWPVNEKASGHQHNGWRLFLFAQRVEQCEIGLEEGNRIDAVISSPRQLKAQSSGESAGVRGMGGGGSKSEQATLAQRDAAIEELRAELLVERFDIEPFSDFSAK